MRALLYTSSYNAVFGGQAIEGGDESADYFPIYEHSDYYSRAKAVAERLVLAANGPTLYSAALRCSPYLGLFQSYCSCVPK